MSGLRPSRYYDAFLREQLEATKARRGTIQYCEYVGHEWCDAGGGLEVCAVCEAEQWALRLGTGSED